MDRIDADVCVVGAGYAGLTAARCLARAGMNAVVMEARDRVRLDAQHGRWHGARHGRHMARPGTVVDNSEMLNRGGFRYDDDLGRSGDERVRYEDRPRTETRFDETRVPPHRHD